jgi:hemerythrin
MLQWKDNYKTGDAEIDVQHRGLFEDVAKVLAAPDRDALLTCTIALIRNTQTHFKYEEAVMHRIGYPQSSSHFKEHTELMSKITNFAERVASSKLSSADAKEFVIDWLLGHIQSSDAKLATYIWTYFPNWTAVAR